MGMGAVLGSQQNWIESTEIFPFPCKWESLFNYHHTLPGWYLYYYWWTCMNRLSSKVYSIYSGYYVRGSGKMHNNTDPLLQYHTKQFQSSVLCAFFLLCTSDSHWSYCFYGFTFCRMSVGIIQCVAFPNSLLSHSNNSLPFLLYLFMVW